jgi:hypothetical protein
MEIRYADNAEVVVSMPRQEFYKLTGIEVKEYGAGQYSNGVYPNEVIGKKFDLTGLLESVYQLKLINECKGHIKNSLQESIIKLDVVYWPIKEITDLKAVEKKPELPRKK